jgi:hypothetical protein
MIIEILSSKNNEDYKKTEIEFLSIDYARILKGILKIRDIEQSVLYMICCSKFATKVQLLFDIRLLFYRFLSFFIFIMCKMIN